MQRALRTTRRHLARLRLTNRRSAAGLLIATLVAGLTLGGIAQLRVDTGIGSFLRDGDPELAALNEKARVFGGDPVVVLLESEQPRALLQDDALQRMLRLEGTLSRLPDAAEVYGPATVINQVAKGAQNLLAQISGSRDALRNQATADARARGADVQAAAGAATADFDRRYGGLLVGALPAGLPTLGNQKFVDTVIFGPGDTARPQWQAVVPTPTAVAVLVRPTPEADQNGTARLVEQVRQAVADADLPTSRVTVSGVPVVTASLSEQAQREFPLLGALALAVVGGLYLLTPWAGRRRARLRPLLAALAGTALVLGAFGWSGRPLSLGVVAFLPVLLGIGSDFPLYLAQPSRRRRVLVAAGAAAAAFGALAASSLPFVRELGIALAGGIVAVVVVALLLRRWLDILPPHETSSQLLPSPTPPRWARAVGFVLALSVAGAGWAALPRLPVEADPQALAAGLPALADAEHTERVLGASGEVSIVLRGPNAASPEALDWSRRAEGAVTTGFGDRMHPVTTLSSLLQFLGPAPTPDEIRSALELLPSYLSSAVITDDRTSSLLVLGIELQDLREQRAMLTDMRAALPPPPPGYTAEVVGLPLAAASAYDAVSADRTITNILAIVLAGLVLLAGLRERGDALRALLASVLAGGWIMAGSALIAASLSPLTAAVGALTAATACEFTVMLADAQRRGRSWIVRSVVLAAGAAVLGYLVLAASRLALLREFGVLLAAGVLASALAATLVVRVLCPVRLEDDGSTSRVAGDEIDARHDVTA